MGFFDLLNFRNPNVLNKDEQEAAIILKYILQNYKNGVTAYGSDEVVKLSTALYYLSFKRTRKKIVPIDEFINIGSILNGNTKGLHYASVFEGIQQLINNACQNTARLNSKIILQDCEKAILITLQAAAKQIAAI